MSLSTGRNKLYNARKTIHARWDSVQLVWNDSVRREFEEKFWNDLDSKVQTTMRAIDRLDQVLHALRQECS